MCTGTNREISTGRKPTKYNDLGIMLRNINGGTFPTSMPKKDSSYDELVRIGTYLHQRNGKIIVPNAEFATDHSTNGTLVVGTWSTPTAIKAGNATKLPDTLADRYQLGPELLLKKDNDLMQEYLKSITDEEEQDDYASPVAIAAG